MVVRVAVRVVALVVVLVAVHADGAEDEAAQKEAAADLLRRVPWIKSKIREYG